MPEISSMKVSGTYSPCSTSDSFSSQSAVIAGDWSCSGVTVIKAFPFSVGISVFTLPLPLRSKKPFRTSFSMMAARVAGVPIPFRSASSGKSSALAASIACKSRSSVKCFGGEVFPSFISVFSMGSVSPSTNGGSIFAAFSSFGRS